MLKCSNPHFGRRCTHFGFIIMIFFSIILRRFHNTSEALIIKRDDKNVSEGENATLSCILTDTNEELMQVIWYRRTIMRQSVEHIYTIFQKSHFANDDVNGLKERLTFTGNVAEGIASLYLTNVTLFDDGVYTCTFILDHSGPVSSTIKLDVKVGPVFHASVVTHPVGRDEVILAVCTAVARPVAQLLWDFGGKSILRVETNSTKHLNGTSTINSYLMGAPSKQMNHKEVCCVVQHPTLRNPQNVSCRLNVEYPPLAKVIPLQTGNKADHVYQCEADANPKPIGYNWTSENMALLSNKVRTEGDKLIFPRLTSDLNGLYVCEVSNEYGSTVASLHLYVATEFKPVAWILITVTIAVIGIGFGVYQFQRHPGIL